MSEQEFWNKYIVAKEYNDSYPIGLGTIAVEKNGKVGLVDLANEKITDLVYSFIDVFEGNFAVVGVEQEEPNEENCGESNSDALKYGLIDSAGNVVLPIEYDSIIRWDNGFYYVEKNGKCGVLTPSLHIAVELNKGMCKKYDDNYIVVDGYDERYGLVDYFDNVIIPSDCYNSFTDVEIIEHGLLKAYYFGKPDEQYGYSNTSIGIYDKRGKLIYQNSECWDISYFGDGLLLVTKRGGNGNKYNLVNLRGKEKFNDSYEFINRLEDGNIQIYKDSVWGMSDCVGNIFVKPKYIDAFAFVKGYAEVGILGTNDKHLLNADGQLLIHDSQGSLVPLNKVFYWATDFINGISIVRYSKGYLDYVGVIDEKGNLIINAEYNYIALESNNTIRVREDDCYGIFDVTGNCIYPTIFTSIEYVGVDRMLVRWNIDIAKEWQGNTYKPGSRSSKYTESNAEFRTNNRSALCDSYGNVLHDRCFLYIKQFVGKYACAVGKIEISDWHVIYKQIGIINMDGQTILPPEFDAIELYKHPFAKLRKKEIYGIANLDTGDVKMFENIKVKKAWEIDAFGRFVYTDDGKYDSAEQEWSGNRGVIGRNGVIVPAGRYSNVELLENGLILVSNDQMSLFGLLGLDGNELLDMKYSYISKFEQGVASICLGGHYEKTYPYKHTEGKWGIVDETGNLLVKCIHDKEIELTSKVSLKKLKLPEENTAPKVLIEDFIPRTSHWGYTDDYADNWDCNNDECGHKLQGDYNGYDYDTIDEVFEGDPGLTWNID